MLIQAADCFFPIDISEILTCFFYSVVEWIAPEHGLLGYGRMTILKQAAEGNYSMNSCR